MIIDNYFSNPVLNGIPRHEVSDRIRAVQEKELARQVGYCYRHSEFYQKKLKAIGVEPGDIRTLEDLRHLPVLMTKARRTKDAENFPPILSCFSLSMQTAPVESFEKGAFHRS